MPNDHDQFTHHFHELYPKLCRFLEGLVGKSACAHDLAQETMLRLFQQSDPIPAEEIRFWVFRVARNLALNELERQRTRSKLSGWVVSLFGSPPRTPEVELVQKEQTTLVLSLIGRLPDHQRAALLLREQEEMSYSEIATVLGVTESKVKVDLFRARMALREQLIQSRHLENQENPPARKGAKQ
jgi:RNA polymerase sigma-70 factor (ECF subfamily)